MQAELEQCSFLSVLGLTPLLKQWNQTGIEFMTIQSNDFNQTGTQLQVQAVEPRLPELRIKPNEHAMVQKLRAYDPTVHGGELVADAPQGAEFGAR